MLSTTQIEINNQYGIGLSIDLIDTVINLIMIKGYLISDGTLNIMELEKRTPALWILEIPANSIDEMLKGKIKHISNNLTFKKDVLLNQKLEKIIF